MNTHLSRDAVLLPHGVGGKMHGETDVPGLYFRQENAGKLRGQCIQSDGLPLVPAAVQERTGRVCLGRAVSIRASCPLNLLQIGILSGADEEKIFPILTTPAAVLQSAHAALRFAERRLQRCIADSLAIRRDCSPAAGEKIYPYLQNTYSTLSLGYIGVYEATKLVTGESHTTEKGHAFAAKLMQRLRETADTWQEQTGLGFSLYGTPAESLDEPLAPLTNRVSATSKASRTKATIRTAGHVDVREPITVFDKFRVRRIPETFDRRLHFLCGNPEYDGQCRCHPDDDAVHL